LTGPIAASLLLPQEIHVTGQRLEQELSPDVELDPVGLDRAFTKNPGQKEGGVQALTTSQASSHGFRNRWGILLSK
jgi:hypothetical protein